MLVHHSDSLNTGVMFSVVAACIILENQSKTVPYHVVTTTSCLLQSIKYTLVYKVCMCVICPSFGVRSEFTGKTKYRDSVRNNSAPHKNQSLSTGLRNVISSRAGPSALEVNNILCGLPPAIQATHCGSSEVLVQQNTLTCDWKLFNSLLTLGNEYSTK